MVLEGIIDINGLEEFLLKMKDFVRDSLSYTDKVFVGMGMDEQTTMTAYEIGRSHEMLISVTPSVGDEGMLYLSYPKNCQVEVTMGGFDMPMENVTETIVDGRIYKVDRSLNTYSGILEVGLILKY